MARDGRLPHRMAICAAVVSTGCTGPVYHVPSAPTPVAATYKESTELAIPYVSVIHPERASPRGRDRLAGKRVACATTFTFGYWTRKLDRTSLIANCMVARLAVHRTVPVASCSRWRIAVSARSASRNMATEWR